MTTPEDPWVQLKFRVRESLRSKLEEAARKNDVSLNAEIVARLERSFEKRPAPPAAEVQEKTMLLLGDVLRHASRLGDRVASRNDPLPAPIREEMLLTFQSLVTLSTQLFDMLKGLSTRSALAEALLACPPRTDEGQ